MITCGLPSTPACKIDEAGTPETVGKTFDQSKVDLDTNKEAQKTAIDGAQNIAVPRWTFTFQFPTGCAPYVTGLRGVILNVCAYQATIHDLMSMIWATVTVFAMISLVTRTIRES